MSATSSLIVDTVVQKLRRSENGRPRSDLVVLLRNEIVQHSFLVRRERCLESLLLESQEIEANLLGQGEQVLARVAIAFNELSYELLKAGRKQSERAALLPLSDGHLLIERLRKQFLKIRCETRRLPLGALRISTLTGLELMLLGWPARAHLVLGLGYSTRGIRRVISGGIV